MTSFENTHLNVANQERTALQPIDHPAFFSALEHFQRKWIPVSCPKMRQINKLDRFRTEKPDSTFPESGLDDPPAPTKALEAAFVRHRNTVEPK